MYPEPEIINTDQGCQFTSEDWIMELKKRGIKISMTGQGRCCDNVYIERLWRSMKYEGSYLGSVQGYRIREYPFRLIFGKMLINCMFKHI